MQCEILPNNLLGAKLPDEEPVPNQPIAELSFDFFGLGQPSIGLDLNVAQDDEDEQNNMDLQAQQNQEEGQEEEDENDWDPWAAAV